MWGIWGSYLNLPKARFYLVKGTIPVSRILPSPARHACIPCYAKGHKILGCRGWITYIHMQTIQRQFLKTTVLLHTSNVLVSLFEANYGLIRKLAYSMGIEALILEQ